MREWSGKGRPRFLPVSAGNPRGLEIEFAVYHGCVSFHAKDLETDGVGDIDPSGGKSSDGPACENHHGLAEFVG